MLGEYIGAGSGTTKLLLHLNGNSTDSSGNGNNGTDTAITYVDGKFGKCASFNGSSSYISIPNSSSLNLTNSFTFNLWFNKQDTSSKHMLIKWGAGTAPQKNQYHLWVNYSGNLSLFVRQSNSADVEIADTSPVPTNSYNLVTFTGDGSNLRIYVNGNLKNTVAWSSSFNVPVSPNPVGIGVKIEINTPSDTAYFNGSIDEVIIESRAWTASEIKKYYTFSLGRF